MPLFMDIHRNAKGLSAEELAKAHQKEAHGAVADEIIEVKAGQ